MNRQAAPTELGVVDDVVVDERGRVDELDDRRIQHGAVALVSGEAGGHQQNRRTHPLPAARLDIAAYLGNQLHLRLDMAVELAIDLLQVGADGFEDVREGRRRVCHSAGLGLYHGRNSLWKFALVSRARSSTLTPWAAASASTTRAT